MEDKKTSNIIGVIIALIIVGVLGFVIYKNFIEIGGNPNNNPTNEDIKQLSENELKKIGLERYNMLYSKTNYSNNSFIFFKDETVTIDNISNQDKLYILYSFLSDEDKNKTGTYDESCFLNKGIYTRLTYPDKCPKESFDKSLLNEKLYTFFDNGMKVDFVDFFASSSNKCFINDSKYNCYLNTSNFTIPSYTIFAKYDSAKQNGDTIEVYSYLLTARKNASSGSEKGIYSNASATNKIDDLPFEIGDTITPELTDKLINQYKDKITKYKSVFKIVNNNYLWQKTEIIK